MYTLFFVILFSSSLTAQLKNGKHYRIIFFGDSITELGVEPKGYISLLRDSIRTLDSTVELIGAGISGHKVTDLQARLERDVLSKKPTLVVIYIGINDVWHWVLPNAKGTTKEMFEAGLKDIIGKIQTLGAQVILCTPSVIGEKNDGDNPQDAMLHEYSAISRKVAATTNATLCDLHSAFVTYESLHNPENKKENILTNDGVHLNDNGNIFVAHEMMKIFSAMNLFSSSTK